MITEIPIRDKNRHVDDDGPIDLHKDIKLGDLYLSNDTTDTFSDPEPPPSLRYDVNDHVDHKNDLETSQFQTLIPTCRNGISVLMELPLKIMNGVSDLLNFQSNSPDSEIPAKRPYSPRPHHNMKQTPTDVARGRGRGRGRSQLRRSGVSQTRHRQERIRQRLTADIQDDLKGFGELEEHKDQLDEMPSTPCADENGRRIRWGANGVETDTTNSSRFPFFFGYCDVKKRKRKQQQNKNGNRERMSISNNCKVRYIPECPVAEVGGVECGEDVVEDVQSDGRMDRKRLQSDRSVDSEDSYCIVFETGSESDFETDYDYTTTDDEDDDDDDDTVDRGSELKVRFSPHPIIHTMITWDYAYRAARRGPWEEMARDRERFKYRINCIARVLDPILVPQHRSEIWQHRFAIEI